MMESTKLESCSIPSLATLLRLPPSKVNGMVTTATVKTPSSLASLAMTGAAPVPVPPPIPAVINTMSEFSNNWRICSSSLSAASRPTSGLAPAPKPRLLFLIPSWILLGADRRSSACLSVLAQTKVMPFTPFCTMVSTALPPPPPTPITVKRAESANVSV